MTWLRIAQRALLWISLAFIIVAVTLMAPSPTQGMDGIDGIPGGLPDFDARTGEVAPTTEQLALVADLGATARWNRFGTPQSIIKYDGYLAEGVAGADAVAVARNWLAANSVLFRLSADELANLELHRDAQLTGSDGHAVTFRQRFGDLAGNHDGFVTVGVVGDKVAYASSSLTGDTTVTGQVQISDKQAWVIAAANVGRTVSLADIQGTKTDNDWSVFAVDGFTEPQRARLTAVPTPTDGVRPAYETIFLDSGAGYDEAYIHWVDAETGAVLLRNNQVHQSHFPVNAFTGLVPQVDGACDEDRGPWVVGPDEDVASIVVAVEAFLTTNDSVIHLKRDGVMVASQDTLFSPEAIFFAPSDGIVPPGSYTVQVCDFVDGFAWDSPNDYTGQIIFNPVALGIAYPPKWKVFESYPDLDLSSDDTRKLWCWESVVQGSPITGCEYEVTNTAARAPWDLFARLGVPSYTMIGNAAVSSEAWTNPLGPGATAFRPLSINRNYDYEWNNEWAENGCTSAFLPGLSNDIGAATANLFAMHNRMHDWSYNLGFTEENWNAQLYNFGNAGLENDPVLGQAQAGALTRTRNNANMRTLPDGIPPITNMYLWQPTKGGVYPPCVDGDFDMAVIGHEYGHLIEVRMIGKGNFRSGHHAGAMGESHSDLMAMEHLNSYGFVPVGSENPYAVGAYVTGNSERGIRNYGMNNSPLNFSNMGYDIIGSQVHSNGEIWSATNFDIRQALIEKYNGSFPASDLTLQRECADGKRLADACPGNRRWIQLMLDSFLLMPTGPTMLDARDAQLGADLMRFGGANQSELWLAFARRGFGQDAHVNNNGDTAPTPDFASALADNATVTFTATAIDELGAPIEGATIYVGHYEVSTSPIADTDPATNAAGPGANNLDNVAEFAPGTYDFLAVAPGYGHVRFTRTFVAGRDTTVDVRFATNWASSSNGATASGDGTNHANLIDDTEATNWQRTGADVVGSTVTIDLSQTGLKKKLRRVNVSALLRPGQSRYTALRQFEIRTCVASAANDQCTAPSAFTTVFTSAEDTFPGEPWRPTVPDMILRSFELPTAVNATHVQIVVLDNQCTGNPAFQGEQDNDLLNATDCRTTSDDPPTAPAAQDRDVRITEVQVFAR